MNVMVIGSAFREYASFISDAFLELGHNVETFVSPLMGIKPYHVLTRIKRKVGIDISDYYNRSINSVSAKAKELYDLSQPELVFVMLGNMLTQETVQYFAKKSIMILYLTDPLNRVPEIYSSLSFYDYIYTYEKTEMPLIKEIAGKDAFGMFGLFSNKAYYTIDSKKDIDIYFVSALYPFRAEIMVKLIEDFPNLNIRVDGNYSQFGESKRIIRAKSRDIQKHFSNINIPSCLVNKYYNRSKIVLNLQHPQSKDGWNSRLTEILGSGAFEIATYNKSVDECFHGCLETYLEYKDLKDKILYYIKNDDEREAIARRGNEKALNSYTYVSAFREMLSSIGVG